MPTAVLGLDIGGANLKAATENGQALSVPFALWKQPDRLPAALAELVAKFPETDTLAVTMTGELCDCFETKRQGVNAILDAVEAVRQGRAVRVWGTDGRFVTVEQARRDHLNVAAANWHALAAFAGRYAPTAGGLLLDVGSTTTDIIPLLDGIPHTSGRTDSSRFLAGELVYAGVRRTPICAVLGQAVFAELFATTQDVFVLLGLLPESPDDCDTADHRPLTRKHSGDRLTRMLGGDRETHSEQDVMRLAKEVYHGMLSHTAEAIRKAYFQTEMRSDLRTVVVSGAGEFFVRQVLATMPEMEPVRSTVSLNDELGPVVSACAPAYAVAVLAVEQRS